MSIARRGGKPASTSATGDLDVLVVGGSQAGLAMGYYLAQLGCRFRILDAGARVGDAWGRRYDSLVLFTPAQHNSLPSLPFSAPSDTSPAKDEVAEYLARYARAFDLPVKLDTRVTSVQPDPAGAGYVVQASEAAYHAAPVVIATGGFQRPYVPALSRDLSPDVVQLHSSQYRNPRQPPPGDVLGERQPTASRSKLAHTSLRPACNASSRLTSLAAR